MNIYLVEAIINGILLGGVLALLALGLNLIFGVMDVVWICYADIVMCGMYAIYFLYVQYGVPLPLTFVIAIVGVSGLGVPYILNIGLWALAAGSAFTFGQRVHAVYNAAKGSGDQGGSPGDQDG